MRRGIAAVLEQQDDSGQHVQTGGNVQRGLAVVVGDLKQSTINTEKR